MFLLETSNIASSALSYAEWRGDENLKRAITKKPITKRGYDDIPGLTGIMMSMNKHDRVMITTM